MRNGSTRVVQEPPRGDNAGQGAHVATQSFSKGMDPTLRLPPQEDNTAAALVQLAIKGSAAPTW